MKRVPYFIEVCAKGYTYDCVPYIWRGLSKSGCHTWNFQGLYLMQIQLTRHCARTLITEWNLVIFPCPFFS